MILFSLIIPCYNEEKNLFLLIEHCRKVFKSRTDVEVIFVNNGSTDNSQQVLEKFVSTYTWCKSVLVEKNQGYGFGILSGLKSAKGNILGWTHADMQTDPNDFLIGLKLFEKYGNDIFVKGRRYGRPLADVFFTLGMSIFETILLKKPLFDINAQPTIFSRSFFESWKNAPHDFSLDLYAYYQARMNKIPIYRFSVLFAQRAHGVSHWNINWKAKQKFILRTIQFSLQLRKKLLP